MPVLAVSNIFGRRLALRRMPADVITDERILATARLVLALSSLATFHFGPTESSPSAAAAYGSLLVYAGYSFALFGVLRFSTKLLPEFSLLVHAGDIFWPALFGLSTGGPNSHFFSYFIFALLAAGFRWGMGEALLTAAGAIGAIITEAFVLSHSPVTRLFDTRTDLNGFIMRAGYLLIFGSLIGYLAESGNRRRAEAARITQLAGKVRVESGLKGTLEAVLRELLKLFECQEVLLVASESTTNRAYLWRTEVHDKMGETVFTSRQLDLSEGQAYLFPLPDNCAGAVWRRGNTTSAITTDSSGRPIRGHECRLPAEFRAQQLGRVLMGAVTASPNVAARVFLINPKIQGNSATQLRFLQNLLNQVTPAVYNVYLLRRLRSRAAAVERARVASDLHDGAIQSLHAIGFRLYVLRNQATMSGAQRDQELLDIQHLVQNAGASIRALIQQLKPLDFDPRHLVDFLANMIERYKIDTGIAANFVCDLRDTAIPPRTCREVAGIVQEALANVAKHSGAKNVLIRLALQGETWILTIDDDGRGFQFCGHFSHSELEEARRGPMIIRDRVRAIGGELSIDTRPGRGARLEITIPRQEQATIA
jgi:signal transduction histidine kinase